VPPPAKVRSLLLVRNGVDHDARVLRAARVAERTLGGTTLVAGVSTKTAPVGISRVEGITVVRFPARPPAIERLRGWPARSRYRRHTKSSEASNGAATDGARVHRPSGGSRVVPAPIKSGSTSALTMPGRVRRILSGISYSAQAIALAWRARPEMVQANDWNTMWAGLFIKYLLGARLVYDSHELWADRNGRWEWRPWLLACEALFVRAANEVLTSSPGYADALAARYRAPRPTVVRNIPERHSAPGAVGTSNDQPEAPLIVYIGGLMPGRGLEQMIDALALIPEARLRAIGPGAQGYRASLLARARSAEVVDRVDLCLPVPPADVGRALAGATAGLCLIQPICRSYELCLPNKLFEYAAAGIPVLASDLPVIGPLVRRDGFGVLAPAGDIQAIAASFIGLLEPGTWTLAARRAHAFAETHSWEGEADALAGAYRRAQVQVA
jgi:glycosyltransferase involved in cell wall biosynthesis